MKAIVFRLGVLGLAASISGGCGSNGGDGSADAGVNDAASSFSSGSSGSSSGSSSGGSSGSSSGGASGPDSGPNGGGSDGGLTCSNAAAVTPVASGTAPGVVAGMVPGPGTFVGGCQIFPADNAWNVDVSSPSIATTTAYALPQGTHLHPDFGGWTDTYYGIPYEIVPSSQPNVSITFNLYQTESDPGPGGWTTDPSAGGNGVTAYPIPNNAKIEGGPAPGQTAGDDHMLVLQQGATCGAPCMLWEVGGAVGGSGPPWVASCGASWNLGSNALRPLGWTSVDAAGLSVFAGLVKLAEVKAGLVTHAVRVTFNKSQNGYVYPATHFAGSSALGSSDPPMGLRLRLKSSFDTSKFSTPGKVIAQGMKTYGLIVADNGSDWYFQGDSDDGWNDQDVTDTYIGELLTDFDKVTGADFDVLDTGAPMNTGE